MKYKFFKINSYDLFSYLTYAKSVILTETNLSIINEYSMKMIKKYNLNLKAFEVTQPALDSLINCCGAAVFEKKLNDYFISPSKLFPLMIYIKFILKQNEIRLYETTLLELEKNLFLHNHDDYRDKFKNLRDKELFFKSFMKNYKSFIHFINHYYSIKPKLKVHIKKGGSNV